MGFRALYAEDLAMALFDIHANFLWVRLRSSQAITRLARCHVTLTSGDVTGAGAQMRASSGLFMGSVSFNGDKAGFYGFFATRRKCDEKGAREVDRIEGGAQVRRSVVPSDLFTY